MSSTASQISDFNLLRRCGKRSSKKSGSSISELYNNLYASQMVAADQRAKMSPQRTISLGSLHHPLQTQFMEPARLSQLETLEAKMASIEVSLSATLKKSKKSSTPVLPSSPSQSSILAHKIAANTSIRSNGHIMMDNHHDKENITQNNAKLQIQVGDGTDDNKQHSNKHDENATRGDDMINESEKHLLVQKIESLKNDIDQKRLAIKNIKMSLDQLDVTDNIDTRIQQAELEYQLGREELNVLSLTENIGKHECRLEEIEQHMEQNEHNTLYNHLNSNSKISISLRAVEFEYDPKSPKFGVGPRKDKPGLFIDWTMDDLGFAKNDRLLEVNGKVVLSVKNKNDLSRLLEVSPPSVRAVVMRDGPTDADKLAQLAAVERELEACRARVEDADRSRHAYKTENVRLSHRVSYLEDQVSELIRCRSANSRVSGVQLFQRGSDTAVVRSKSPKHGVSAIQQYKRKQHQQHHHQQQQQPMYEDINRPPLAAAHEMPVKTRIRTVPRLYGYGSASVESLHSSPANAPKLCDDLQHVASPKRTGGRYPAGGPRNSSRTRHIREAQQTLFQFLDSESASGDRAPPYLQLRQCTGSGSTSPTAGSVRSLDLKQQQSQHQQQQRPDSADQSHHQHRLKSTEYYARLTDVADGRSLSYDSEQSAGRRSVPVPPKKPLRLSMQQRRCVDGAKDYEREQHGGHQRINDTVDPLSSSASSSSSLSSAINNAAVSWNGATT